MTHAHHFLIAPPDGPMSRGTCKGCGAVREFVNGSQVWGPEAWRQHSDAGMRDNERRALALAREAEEAAS